jgi:peptidoglycan LD-endopeptidase LytH
MRRGSGLLLLFALGVLASSSDEFLRALREAPAPQAATPLPGLGRPATAEERLASRHLEVPVKGVQRSQVRDNFDDKRSAGRKHKAIDIMAPTGTPVLAADEGRIAKISSNRAGGLAVYQVDGSGRFVYYYAHLSAYKEDLREGQAVQRGDVIGYVGTTGNAPKTAPHLHFQVMELAQERRWWGGEAVNPYEALARGDPVTTASK